MSPRALMIDVAAILALGCLGVTVAWLMRRTTNLAARNLYPPALLSLATLITGAAAHTWAVVLIIAPVCALTGSAAVYAPSAATVGSGCRGGAARLRAGAPLDLAARTDAIRGRARVPEITGRARPRPRLADERAVCVDERGQGPVAAVAAG